MPSAIPPPTPLPAPLLSAIREIETFVTAATRAAASLPPEQIESIKQRAENALDLVAASAQTHASQQDAGHLLAILVHLPLEALLSLLHPSFPPSIITRAADVVKHLLSLSSFRELFPPSTTGPEPLLDALTAGLAHPIAQVRLLAVSVVSTSIKGTEDAQALLDRPHLLTAIARSIADIERSVATPASQWLQKMILWHPEGALAQDSILVTELWEMLKNESSIVRFRIYDAFVEVLIHTTAVVAVPDLEQRRLRAFELAIARELLLTKEDLLESDPLNALNAIEVAHQISRHPAGLDYLDRHGQVDVLLGFLKIDDDVNNDDSDDDSMDSSLMMRELRATRTLALFCTWPPAAVARLQLNVQGGVQATLHDALGPLDAIIKYLSGVGPAQEAAIAAVGSLGATPPGLALLLAPLRDGHTDLIHVVNTLPELPSPQGIAPSVVSTWAHQFGQAIAPLHTAATVVTSMDAVATRLAHYHTAAALLHVPAQADPRQQQQQRLVWAMIKSGVPTAEVPLMTLLLQEPEEEARCAVYALLQVLAGHVWLRREMILSPGFFATLLNRTREANPGAREWQYAVIYALFASPNLFTPSSELLREDAVITDPKQPLPLPPAVIAAGKRYVAEGPHATLNTEAGVAVGDQHL